MGCLSCAFIPLLLLVTLTDRPALWSHFTAGKTELHGGKAPLSSHRSQDSTLLSSAPVPHRCVGTTRVPSDNRSPSVSPSAHRLTGEGLGPRSPQDPLGLGAIVDEPGTSPGALGGSKRKQRTCSYFCVGEAHLRTPVPSCRHLPTPRLVHTAIWKESGDWWTPVPPPGLPCQV